MRKNKKQFDVEVVLGVLAIIFCVLASVLAFGIFHRAGDEGNMLFEGLYRTIGLFAFVTPLVLIYSAYLLWKSKLPEFSPVTCISLIVIVASFSGLVALIDPMLSGTLGALIVTPIVNGIGTAPTILALLALLYVGMMLVSGRKHIVDIDGLSESSLGTLLTTVKNFFSFSIFDGIFSFMLRGKTSTEEEYTDEENEEELEEDEESEERGTIREELLRAEKSSSYSKSTDDKRNAKSNITEETEIETKELKLDPEFVHPPFDLLNSDNGKPAAGDTIAKMKSIKQTLDNFNIPVEMGSVTVGPTVTQFTLKPAQGVNVKRVLGLKDNLQMALSATHMHIEAPIPGRPFVGIEVPNEKKQQLGLRSMLDHPKFKDASNLTIAIGKDIIGNPVYGNIETMPHLLIAGATRSGKSVTVQNIITSLLYKNSPSDLRLMVIDPKRVEFTMYKNLPHLGTPIITDAKNAIKCLNWAIGEMERRYSYFADEYVGIQNIGDYNKKILQPALEKIAKGKKISGENMPERLPYIVIVFDEFNDFMLSYPKEITIAITNLTQKGRAAGVHLILATQRPDVKVITGTIKANITARIALKTSSAIDSRTILDQSGAEDLLGNGDMLYMDPNHPRPVRVQAPFISSEEVRAVINNIKETYTNYEVEEIDISKASLNINTSGGSNNDDENGDDESEPVDDAEYVKAKDYVIATGKASTTQLQSRFGWGYPKAAKFIMQLERHGVVGPSINNKQREVLIKIGGQNTNQDPVDDLF
jgi:S-DNA-T family DNA segregation ATPase FtsK/SpoIIIE